MDVLLARFVHLETGETMHHTRQTKVILGSQAPSEALECIALLAKSSGAAKKYLGELIAFERSAKSYTLMLAGGKIILHTIDLRGRRAHEVRDLHDLIAHETYALANVVQQRIATIARVHNIDTDKPLGRNEVLRRVGVHDAGPWVSPLSDAERFSIGQRIYALEARIEHELTPLSHR